eukprot:TRINITY_DN67525_c3_g1_i2.p1 TRINITY_DN67525_c3_g1~~TRINITY_DN67525_c3_g1_i2.p1  ORF type:complete len:697 (+),score=121.28 TRINITY_DN67525_c3_g1_i2:44-2134(+)
MEVDLGICLVDNKGSPACINCGDGKSVQYQAPGELLEAQFPISDATFNFERVLPPGTTPQRIQQDFLADAAANFLQKRQNTVVYTYGQKGLPKRQLFFGESADIGGNLTPKSGVLQHLVHQIFESGALGSSVIKFSGYCLGVSEAVTDLLNIDNASAVVADSIKEGPSISNLTRTQVGSYAQAVATLKSVAEVVEDEFADVLDETKGATDPFPPYNPCHTVFSILRYANEEAASDGSPEVNSINVVCLGDSERPPLCGINLDQLNKYEKTHKTHTAVVGILGAIRCNRLRIPFTKSKLTSLLKRAYNQEKNNPNNDENLPTKSFMFVYCFNDPAHAEESYHTLLTAKRIVNVMGGGGVGPASRDLSVEKWRLEQDIIELKDELTIAKAVHDYKPYIYDQPKVIQNIQEEELKRINQINKKREEARAKAQADMRLQAQREAQVIIEQEEKKSNSNLKELEEKLQQKLLTNLDLNAERDKKVKEFDKQLEKIKRKKQEEEDKAKKLQEEIRTIEDELNARNQAIAKAKEQLEVLNKDHARGREMILQGREETKEKRMQVYQQRRQQRQQWLKEIDETNTKVLEQIKLLSKERQATGAPDDGSEARTKKDIETLQKFIPELISIDEPNHEASDSIRKQLEEYYEAERKSLQKKMEDEAKRKQELEKAAEIYKGRINDHQNRIKKDQLQEALKKEKHLEG